MGEFEKFGHLLVAFGIIVWFGYRQFNQWTEYETRGENSDSELLAFAPPRSFTSLGRFVLIAVLYCFTLFLLYGFLCYIFGNPPQAGTEFLKVRGVSAESAWLVALLVVTGLSPIVPGLNNVERAVRQVMHNWAVVPTKAQQIADEIASPATKFELDEAFLQDAVLPRVAPLFRREDFTDGRASTIAQKWCRLNYLLCKFAPPAQGGLAARGLRSPYTTRFYNDFEALKQELAEAAKADPAVLASRGGSPAAVGFSERLDAMLHRLYVLMSCRAFGSARSLEGVGHFFKRSYGVDVQRIELAAFPTVPIFDALMATSLAVLGVALLFWYFNPNSREKVQPFVWALSTLATHGSGLLVGWLVFGARKRRHMDRGQPLMVAPPLSRGHMLVTLILGFGFALLPVALASIYYRQSLGAPMGTLDEFLALSSKALEQGWPWASLGAATAFGAFLHLERTASREVSPRLALFSGAAQAAANLAIALLILALNPAEDAKGHVIGYAEQLSSSVTQLVLVLTAVIGMTLGIFLPRVVHGHGFDMRGGAKRHRIEGEAGKAVFTFQGRQYRCRVESMSTTGCVLHIPSGGPRPALRGLGSLTLADQTAVPARVAREIGRELDAAGAGIDIYGVEFTTEPSYHHLPMRLRQRLREFLARLDAGLPAGAAVA